MEKNQHPTPSITSAQGAPRQTSPKTIPQERRRRQRQENTRVIHDQDLRNSPQGRIGNAECAELNAGPWPATSSTNHIAHHTHSTPHHRRTSTAFWKLRICRAAAFRHGTVRPCTRVPKRSTDKKKTKHPRTLRLASTLSSTPTRMLPHPGLLAQPVGTLRFLPRGLSGRGVGRVASSRVQKMQD